MHLPPGDRPERSTSARQKIIVLQGPTGVGKTAVALKLAHALKAEIINADSQQVFRHMDIGTAKPTAREQAEVPHHLFSLVDPDEEFNAARFMHEARRCIADIAGRGKVPLVVGGTGLYVRALTCGLSSAPPADAEVRRELRCLGKEELRRRLDQVDPEAAGRISPNDLMRMVRALEVYELTGETISQHNSRHGFQDVPFESLKLCLDRSRPELYRRINRRVEAMLEAGLVREVQELYRAGYGSGLRPLGSIGYRHIGLYLQGLLTLSEAVAQMQQETRRFAKRQLTWLRRDSGAVWIELPAAEPEILPRVKKFLNIA